MPDVDYIQYRAYSEKKRWSDWAKMGEEAGTTGEGLKVQEFEMKYTGPGKIEAQTHVENRGWGDVEQIKDTHGSDKKVRLEAFRLRLVNAPGFHVVYRAHVENIGWQDWVQDWDLAGTEGQALQIEAIQIRITYDDDFLQLWPHCEDYGWMNPVGIDQDCGTTGENKRLECFKFQYKGPGYLTCIACCEDIGWQSPVTDGEECGTTGQSRKLECIKFELRDGQGLKLEYCAHIENSGWEDWVKLGKECGYPGKSKKIEAIKVRFVTK